MTSSSLSGENDLEQNNQAKTDTNIPVLDDFSELSEEGDILTSSSLSGENNLKQSNQDSSDEKSENNGDNQAKTVSNDTVLGTFTTLLNDEGGDILTSPSISDEESLKQSFTGDAEILTGEVEKSEIDIARETLNSEPITGEKETKGVTVSVEALTGTFPEGTELRIVPITIKKELNEIKEQIIDSQENIVEDSELVAFDISFIYILSDGTEIEVQPKDGEGVKVSFNYEDNKNLSKADKNEDQEIKVFHLDDKDENGEKVAEGEEVVKEVKIDTEASSEGEVVVDAESFSIYAVIRSGQSATITITYDANEGKFSDSTTSKVVTYTKDANGLYVASANTQAPNRDGYMFDGWYDGNVEWYGVANDTASTSKTVSAHWLEFDDLDFTFNGTNYTIMDRNLGAEAPAAGTYNGGTAESLNKIGKYYQWGNNHGFRNGVNGDTLSEIDSTDVLIKNTTSNPWGPGNYYSSATFVTRNTSPYRWDDADTYDLWGGQTNTPESKQGPCPEGYHVPSNTEWQNIYDNLTTSVNCSSYSSTAQCFAATLQLPFAGNRDRGNSNVHGQGSDGFYWSSTRYNEGSAYGLYFNSSDIYPQSYSSRSYAFSVRCFKNSPNKTLTFHPNGGAFSGMTTNTTITVKYKEKNGIYVPTPNVQNPNRAHYMFDGWCTDANCTTEWNGVVETTTATVLYAKWLTFNDYEIKDANGKTLFTIMDRNLGATQAGTYTPNTDGGSEAIRGKYFQWGNNWGFKSSGSVPKTSSTPVDASAYGPGNYYSSSTFILRPDSSEAGYYYRWDSSDNGDLWGGVTNTDEAKQGPCPAGYHVPDTKEWKAAYDLRCANNSADCTAGDKGIKLGQFFNLPFAGHRYRGNSNVFNQGSYGIYWSSTRHNENNAYCLYFYSSDIYPQYYSRRSLAFSVRCFKNSPTQTLTFSADNGTADTSANLKRWEAATTNYKPTDPEKAGYKFLGWYKGNEAFTFGASKYITENTTLTAHWEKNPWYEYNANGGYFDTNKTQTTKTVKYEWNGSAYTTSETVTLQSRDGYTFDGWQIIEGGNKVDFDPATAAVTQDRVLYAKWSEGDYAITYNGVDDADNSQNPTTYNVTDTIQLKNPTRTGYTFAGWTPNSIIPAGSTGPKTFTATWTANTYSITYRLNGGINNDNNPSSYTYGEGVSSFAEPTKKGYNFVEWTPSRISDTVTGNQTIEASWTPKEYTISYELNGGTNASSNPSKYTIESGDIVLQTPTKEGYTFKGWAEGNTILSGSTGNRTFTAQWEAKQYTIIYNLNGGVNTGANPSSYTIESDTITLSAPSKRGYTFSGWTEGNTIPAHSTGNKVFTAEWNGNTVEYYVYYYAGTDILGVEIRTATAGSDATIDNYKSFEGYQTPAGTTPCASIEEGKICKVTGYQKSEYILTFKSDDSTVYYTTGLVFDSEITGNVIPSDPSKNGYTFAGWDKAIPDRMPAKNVTITAKWTQDTYKITYRNTKGVEHTNSGSYSLGDEFDFLPLSKSGYNFSGWSIEGITPSDTGDKVVEAIWELESYTINFVDTDEPSIQYTIESGAFTLPVLADRDGYRFLGWIGDGYTIPAKEIRIPAGSMGNKTFTAQWETKQYTITYELNGGVNNPSNYSTYTYGNSDIEIYAPSREGYEFSGWTQGNIIPAHSTGNKLFTAEWSGAIHYSITYNLDGGVNHGQNPDYYTIDDLVHLKNPTKAGYEFAGWAEGDIIPAGSTENKTFTAQWNIIHYNITYILDGGANDGSNPATYTIPDHDIVLSGATKDGYTFNQWYPLMGNTITSGSVGDLVLTAKWTANNYTLTFSGVENAKLPNGDDYPASAGYTIEDTLILTNPVMDGKVFKGWRFEDSETIYPTMVIVKSFGNKTVVAVWGNDSYAITYELNGGINASSNPTSYTYGSGVNEFAEPTKKGYDFVEWTPATISNTATGDKVIIASWTPKEYSIDYVLNGGVNNSNNPSKYTIESGDITLLVPTKEGYTFKGWTEGNVIPSGSTENKVFHATWEPKEYSIIYNLNGGINNTNNPSNYTYGSGVSSFATPTKNGYTFSGWSPNSISSTATGIQEISASWTPKEYTISYELNEGINSDQNPSKYTIESGDIVLSDPTKDGYKFLGWAEGNTILSGSIGNRTFTAKWEARHYAIIYNLDGGVNNANNPSSYTIEQDINLLPPTKDDYIFKGWTPSASISSGSTGEKTFTATWSGNEVEYYVYYYAGEDILGVQVNTGIAGDDVELSSTNYKAFSGYTTPTSDTQCNGIEAGKVCKVTGYAKAEYTLTFKNGTETIISTSIPFDTEITDTYLPTSEPTKDGYVFAGWDKTIPDRMPAKNVTISAKWTNDDYKITYRNTKGAENVNSGSYTHGDSFTFETLSKSGYNFVSWTPAGIATDNTGDKVVEATWTLVPYTVSFTGDETDTLLPITYTIESGAFTLPVLADSDGYTFLGWTGDGYTIPAKEIRIPAGSMGNKEFTANWSLDTYTISYNLNGGVNNDNNPSSYTYNDTFTLEDPTKDGYEFSGWAEGEIIPIHSTGDKTFTAEWKAPTSYEIHYNNLSGADNSMNPNSYTINDFVQLKNPIRDGYNFLGWTEGNIIMKGSTEEKTFTAQWEAKEYQIVYKLNGGINSDNNPSSYTYGVGVASLSNPEKRGYDFSGWLFGDEYISQISTTQTGSIILRAIWNETGYAITYVLNGGENSALNPTSYTVNSGTIVLQAPTRDGYTFKGWLEGNTIPAGSIGEKTFTAQWEAKGYSITYELDGGTNASSNPISYTYGSGVNEFAEPTKKGYTFGEWTPSSISATATGDKVITASWTPKEYSITYELDGGINASSNPSKYTIESGDITLLAPTKEGYTFLGWTEGNVIPAGSTENKVFHANWEVKQYSITYKLNGGVNNDNNPSSYTYGEGVSSFATPTKNGYTFGGWTPSSISNTATGNQTIEASWTPKEYTITYELDGGTANPSNPSKYTIESGDIVLSAPTKEGYTFKGWTEGNVIPAGSTENKVFHANWEVKQYSITYKLNGGVNNPSNPSSYTIEQSFDLLSPSREYYTFKGWSPSGNISLGSTGNKVFTATWSGDEVDYYVYYYEGNNVLGLTIKTAEVDSTVTLSGSDYKSFEGYSTPTSSTTCSSIVEGKICKVEGYTKSEYTLTFKDGNNVLYTTGLAFDSAITDEIIPSDPTKDGYVFAGWDKAIPDRMPAKNVTISAKWTQDDYKITYKNTKGVEHTNSGSYSIGDQFEFSPLSKSGYQFIGWTPSQIHSTDTGDVVVTANWNLIPYTINFVNAEMDTINYTVESGDLTISVPADREGYTFLGWTGDGYSVPAKEIRIPAGSMGNKTFTANWSLDTYTITYNLNGGVNHASNPTSYTVESNAITLQTPTKDGYVFGGWTPSSSIPAHSTGNKTFTATWNLDSYDIIYNGVDGADNSMNTGSYTVNDFVQLKNPIKTGYTFAGWTEGNYISKGTTGTQTFTANWQLDTYTITYYMNGGENSAQNPVSYTVESGAIQLQTPSKEGYTFSMWSPTDSIPAHSVGNKTFVAYWEANTGTDYKVIHVKQNLNQEYDLTDASLVYEETLHGTTNTKVTPVAKEYSGFTKAQEQEITILPDGSTVVEYRYPRKSYSFTLENVDGVKTQGTSVNKDYLYESEITLSAQSETGYTWQSWEITSGGVTTTNSNQNIVFTMPATAVSVKPILSHNEYTISFNSNGGTPSVIPSQTGYYGESLDMPTVTMSGFVFQGWFEGDKRYDGSTKLPNRNVSLVAKWTPAGQGGQTRSVVTVKHFLMDTDGNYSTNPTDTVMQEVDLNTTYTGAVKNVEGFTSPAEQSIIVSVTEDNVINYYYSRNKFTLTLNQTTGFVYNTLSGTQEVYYGADIKLNGIIEEGYSWSGWNGLGDDGEYTSNPYFHFTMPAHSVTATPTVKTNEYKAIFKDGETIISQISVKYGETITLPATPSKAGYTFKGWNNIPADGKMPAKDIEIKAQWDRNGSSGGGGGGGGGGSSSKSSSETKTHGSAPEEPLTGDTKTIEENVEDIQSDLIDNEENKEEKSESKNPDTAVYNQELIDAYTWAKGEGITSMPTIEDARMDEGITREELAKMMVVYMSKVLGKQPVISKTAKYKDVSVKTRGQELYDYIQLSYQYQIMGIDANGKALKYFNPTRKVSRAEFATVLSRVLYGDKYNQEGKKYYEKHIQALQKAGILTNTTPTIKEVRGWIMLMLYRSWKEMFDKK